MVTDEMKAGIKFSRMARMSELSVRAATDYECMVYLHTATLAGRPSERWCRIYEHLFSQAYPDQAKKIGLYRDGLDEMDTRELDKLREWIYERQVESMKQRRAS
jgi:hypothetical protein